MKKPIEQWQIDLFESNFDRQQYADSKAKVQKALDESTDFPSFRDKIKGYSYDYEYLDDYVIVFWEFDWDSSKMKTDADYVGVRFLVWINYRNPKKSHINIVEFYSSQTFDKEVELMCYFDPNTLKILEWNDGFI